MTDLDRWRGTPDSDKVRIPVWGGYGQSAVYVWPVAQRRGPLAPQMWLVYGYGSASGLDSSDISNFDTAEGALEWAHTWLLMNVPEYDGRLAP